MQTSRQRMEYNTRAVEKAADEIGWDRFQSKNLRKKMNKADRDNISSQMVAGILRTRLSDKFRRAERKKNGQVVWERRD